MKRDKRFNGFKAVDESSIVRNCKSNPMEITTPAPIPWVDDKHTIERRYKRLDRNVLEGWKD